MTIGERIEARRKALGIKSQSELARSAGIGQSTLNGLIRNPYRWSPYLTKIARSLKTTVEYLTGETDDPDQNAPSLPPEPTVHFIRMDVALPSERALAQMFEGLLEVVDRAAPLDELARELAQLLPIALSALKGPLSEMTAIASVPLARAEAPAIADREPTR